MIHVVNYEQLSSFDPSQLTLGDTIDVRVDIEDETTTVAELFCESTEPLVLLHMENYYSPYEFATVTMKQSLTLYVKHAVVSRYPDTYTLDDPRLHSYVCKLSYAGIKYVAENLDTFAEQFHSGRVEMHIPNKFPGWNSKRSNSGRSSAE